MIISMTPLRVSFLGGGTDYPEHFLQHGGATLSTAIDKFTYITVSPLTRFSEHRFRVSYSKTELCRDCDEIQHPSVRECLRFLEIDGGVEIHVVSDLPARTGLGSSSSFTVGLLHALHAYRGELVDRERLAAEAVHVEREMIKERVGLQDQYAAACGGLRLIDYHTDGRVAVQPITVSAERTSAFQERLMLFYTGVQRTAHDVLEQQVARTSRGDITEQLQQLHRLVGKGLHLLGSSADLCEFGQLLHEAWQLKRQFSPLVTTSLVDDAYAAARRAGAVGGKLLGAGGGGFLLLYVEQRHQAAVRDALSSLHEVHFRFELEGSRVIFYRP